MISKRIIRLSEKIRNTPATICLDRARLITEFYGEPSMEPMILRRAKSFAYVLDNKKIFIDEDSVIAGHMASRLHAVPIYPEMTSWLYDDLETLDTRKSDHFEFLPGEKDELREIVKLWKGRTFGDQTASVIDPDVEEMIELGVFTKGISNKSSMNHAPAYYDMVKYGYRHYINECRKRIEEQDNVDIDDMESRITWRAMIIVMEALIRFAHRYAELAENKAAECEDEVRREQLFTIAKNCKVVPENAPENFHQAVQLVWFTHLAMMMEVNSNDHCIGRFDQYMYPFYEKDLENGVEKAFIADLIHEFKLKIAEMWEIRTARESSAYPGCPLWIHMIIGGILPDGSDGCNELTDLILSCMDDLQTKEPCVSFRYHENVDTKIFRHALEVARRGGHPAIFSDETNVSDLLRLGYTLEEARDWGICGCIEPSVPGISDFQSNAGYFNPIKVFEIMLHDGIDPRTGIRLGPHTGNVREFTCIEQFKEAFEAQLSFFMHKFIVTFNRIVSMHAHACPTITGSCFTEGCIAKGRVLQRKGADHRFSAVAITGIANVADSLEAIAECVFNKKYLTVGELMDLLDNNFNGKENIRLLLLNKAAKYGNNVDSVDSYAAWLTKLCDDEVKQYRDGRDGDYTTVIASQSYNVVLGTLIGALPDGRKAGEALADNASPMYGMDLNGPTAALSSISEIDPRIPQSGVLVNQRFDPAVVRGEKGLDILETLVRTYFAKKGQHIQLNVVDDETLRDAQVNPDKHKNILVRVAGYSAYFVDLEKDIQDNIIARTMQQTL